MSSVLVLWVSIFGLRESYCTVRLSHGCALAFLKEFWKFFWKLGGLGRFDILEYSLEFRLSERFNQRQVG